MSIGDCLFHKWLPYFLYLLEKTDLERDLGILISKDLKWGNQVEKTVKLANSIIAQIKNSFTYFDAELVKLLYVSSTLRICGFSLESIPSQGY